MSLCRVIKSKVRIRESGDDAKLEEVWVYIEEQLERLEMWAENKM